jgi:hypothetical protein
MYSGTTLTTYSGRILGAHQKIDRVARKHVETIIPGSPLPKIGSILHFEGGNGPDAMKRKSPSKDEPWHFIQPYDLKDTQLIGLITGHYKELITAMKQQNDVRAAFEAAWLAHAMVDGLTPAHQYPYEEKLIELRSGQAIGTRTNLRERLLMTGERPSHQVTNNWKMWGPKGLFTTHAAFECGVATLIAPLGLRQAFPKPEQLDSLKQHGLAKWYRRQAQTIADWKIYDNFYLTGWTTTLARQVRSDLAPLLVQVVATVWATASQEVMQTTIAL